MGDVLAREGRITAATADGKARGDRSARRRREPNAESQRLLDQYFGGRVCIIDGTDGAEWHHLDDDESNPWFEDFVPLGAGWNRKLRDVRRVAARRGVADLPGDLTPDRLTVHAEASQSQWNPSAAYGLSRLAYYVGLLYVGKPVDELLLYTSNTLRYLRHRPDYRLLHDVIRRDLAPLACRRGEISSYSAVRVLFEIACLFSESNHIQRAYAVHRTIHGRLPRLHPGDGWYLNARRRADIVFALVEDSPSQAAARLERAARRAPAQPGVQVGADVYRSLHLLEAGRLTEARDVLEPRYALIVPPLEVYADATRRLDRTMKPPLNISPAAHYLQAYAVVYREQARHQRLREREFEEILRSCFRQSGALVDHEVPFSWHKKLPFAHDRLCRPLPGPTLFLLDRAVADLVGVLHERRTPCGAR